MSDEWQFTQEEVDPDALAAFNALLALPVTEGFKVDPDNE